LVGSRAHHQTFLSVQDIDLKAYTANYIEKLHTVYLKLYKPKHTLLIILTHK